MALVGPMKVKEAMVGCRAVMEAETGIVVVLVEEAIMAHETMRRVDLEVDMAEAIVACMTMHSAVLEQEEIGEASLTNVSGKE